MEKKILFMAVKEDDKLGYEVLKDFEAKDGLNVLAMAVDFTYRVAKEMIGLTDQEAQHNIYKAVDIALSKHIEENEGE